MAGKTLKIKDGLESRTYEFSGVQRGIIMSGEFQRLNYINNLGCGYLVYPNAQLKRFSHCIGAAYLGGMFARKLGLSQQDSLLAEVSLLLHDLGHGPFSHATENHDSLSHEELTIGLITGAVEMPRRYCQGNIPRILNQHGIDPSEIADVISGKHQRKILCQLVSGYFDLDKGDYLRRDAYATGAKIGEIDIDRMMQVIVEESGDLSLLEKGTDSMVHFILARKNMYRNVYSHKRTAIFEEMLRNAVAWSGMKQEETWWLTDDQLINRLAQSTSRSIDIADMFYANMQYEPVFTLGSDSEKNLAAAEALHSQHDLAERIEKETRLKRGEVIMIYKLPKKIEGLPFFPVACKNGAVRNLFADPKSVASIAEMLHPSKFYMIAAVHPLADESQKKRVADMVYSAAGESS